MISSNGYSKHAAQLFSLVSASQKNVSLFETHTDSIVQSLRDMQFGQKFNFATQQNGFIAYGRIEDGNPADVVLHMPVLDISQIDCQKCQSVDCQDGQGSGRENRAIFGSAMDRYALNPGETEKIGLPDVISIAIQLQLNIWLQLWRTEVRHHAKMHALWVSTC